jgi:hypothetical protein
MTIIDRKTGISYPYLTVKQASKLIGVPKMTLYRWKKTAKMQEFNHLLIVFSEADVTLPVLN